MIGDDGEDSLRWRLPAGLEVLEVYYDTITYARFLGDDGTGTGTGAPWLMRLAQEKTMHFPALQRVALAPTEGDLDEEESEGEYHRWILPLELMQAFEQANVALSISLNNPYLYR